MEESIQDESQTNHGVAPRKEHKAAHPRNRVHKNYHLEATYEETLKYKRDTHDAREKPDINKNDKSGSENATLAQLMLRLEKLERLQPHDEEKQIPSVPEPEPLTSSSTQIDDILQQMDQIQDEEEALNVEFQNLKVSPENLETLVHGELKKLSKEIFKIKASAYVLCLQSRALAKAEGEHEPGKEVLDKQVALELGYLAKSLTQATASIHKRLQ